MEQQFAQNNYGNSAISQSMNDVLSSALNNIFQLQDQLQVISDKLYGATPRAVEPNSLPKGGGPPNTRAMLDNLSQRSGQLVEDAMRIAAGI